MSKRGEFQERYRRVGAVLDGHPHLSGMMTDEIQGDIDSMLLYVGGISVTSLIPTDPTPDFELEIGYDEIPAEDEDDWTPREIASAPEMATRIERLERRMGHVAAALEADGRTADGMTKAEAVASLRELLEGSE